ncbi:MAG: membrane protein insertion efficiency factor YidD [Ruminococcaceae bacterium]|nr:membrane protein insertion efficiency factor YidD [Oscillospiraceae bacterium]
MKKFMLRLILFYQRHISSCTPPVCRFRPTCSAYAYQAIQKYGALKGGWLAFKRLCRCNPFNQSDWYDPVP